jgi:hypothetical protein
MESSEPDLDLIERALVQEAESERERATAPPLGLARLLIWLLVPVAWALLIALVVVFLALRAA